jgi:hypothetical protein
MTDLHLGFTGTQQGMTPEQMVTVLKLIFKLKPKSAHHGDCIGADEEFHQLCLLAKVPLIVIHPPDNPKKRAQCFDVFAPNEHTSYHIWPEKPYLVRNQDIVDECGIVIATPHEVREQQRSGTWSTMRKTQKSEKDLITVWPSGTKTIGDWR